jgi:DNA-binding transcriptional MerR regulator
MDKLLQLAEVSEITGIPENTLRYWRQLGTGPKSARLGRRVVYRERDVTAWVDAQFEVQARSKAAIAG